ncbi:alpha-galactosidase [Paenibacillus yonginensis]|uniref:Alpha-galactosidase n=1 Tax=Paenibacillus yonginensis TaxID=1462996 RepID=A0A1B1MYB1_9BACL|nr:glycoside hydrolase family 36 protein [Paenibacillus yonginensis]ANS74170.1 alpha-galactosidase [Paenibacillus yonginensis]
MPIHQDIPSLSSPGLLFFSENGLALQLEITDSKDVRLLHFGRLPAAPDTSAEDEDLARSNGQPAVHSEQLLLYERLSDVQKPFCRLLELQLTGEDRAEYHGRTHRASYPGLRMEYASHADYRNKQGRKLEFVLLDPVTELRATQHFQFLDGVSHVVRCWTELQNEGKDAVSVEYISSFAFSGLDQEGTAARDDKMCLTLAYNGWQSELQWRTYTLPELGMPQMTDRSSKRITGSNTGSWSAAELIPMAVLQNTDSHTAYFWQIEHNGSWHWELFEQGNLLSLLAGGPNEHDNHWWKKLEPGESFASVVVAAGSVCGGFEEAAQRLTEYRRRIRRPNEDNRLLPVIFNDYMNCLWGKPTTEQLLPLIDSAAETGCEVFCIDAGWYADGLWWDEVGEWLPSRERFPEGLPFVLKKIRDKGMVPGLWLELEVMGINSLKLADTDDSWFFMRHGKRVKDRSRYQLDYRNPEVRAYADRVISRLVEEYGVGYIKMDYNINSGVGTELEADSFGDGLLAHNRAYLAWLDGVFAKYPDLIIENCSSGGMRMDYAMLSRHSIQSTSDQENYLNYALIAAGCPGALTPEQAAVWSYPLREGDDEEVIFNMVNAMLLRIHQSGHLAELSPERRTLVQEGIDYYKKIRGFIPEALPFWPLGLPDPGAAYASLGLKAGDRMFIAVWQLKDTEEACLLSLPGLYGQDVQLFKCAYPKQAADTVYTWDHEWNRFMVQLPGAGTARLFEFVTG